MPFFSLHLFTVFAGMLLLIGSFSQATVAATPSLELSGNFTLPSLHNISNHNIPNYVYPPSYIIPDTNPRTMLKIQRTGHDPLDYVAVTYMVIHGLDSLVQETIRSHGDRAIPQQGMRFLWLNTAIFAKSHLPGTLDLTYGVMATLLRGIWEIVSLWGANALHMDVFIGGDDEAHYRGRLTLYRTAVSKETA